MFSASYLKKGGGCVHITSTECVVAFALAVRVIEAGSYAAGQTILRVYLVQFCVRRFTRLCKRFIDETLISWSHPNLFSHIAYGQP